MLNIVSLVSVLFTMLVLSGIFFIANTLPTYMVR